MNKQDFIADQDARLAKAYSRLVRPGLEPLKPLKAKMDALDTALTGLARIGDKATAQAAERLREKLAATEPSVTMIGQVKAGKTSLVNAMVGWPDLLPADVNPWTSVVTSLHLSPVPVDEETQARFTFFNRDEWDKLVVNGGRMGELAGRAGADSEVEKVRRQIAEMQEKSRRRLGRKFELLLGQSHDYGYFDSDLIQRYVCLGDHFEEDDETSKTQGRFADITKSAEVFMERADLPMRLCIRDTPGVNDTFMVREQITIRAIRDSRTCVVVLSAHQALSSVDMALIRLISNVKSREVVIFVNRIDELAEPATQVPEIRESIRATLRAHQGPEDATLIFGSAYWANCALQGQYDIGADSAAALDNWANVKLPRAGLDDQLRLWALSGVPTLFHALSQRIVEGPGAEALDAIAKSTRNLASGLQASNNIVSMRKSSGPRQRLDRAEIEAWLKEVDAVGTRVIGSKFDKLIGEFGQRIDRANDSFLQRATAALIDHLERYGETDVWKYDPTGLRVLMRSGYQLFAKRAQATASEVFEATAGEFTDLYRRMNLVNDSAFSVEPPDPPLIPPPVLLGQTIALDMQANWWTRWWRKRRGYEAFAEEFYGLIESETRPIVDGLKRDHAAGVRAEAMAAFQAFVGEQAGILMALADQDDLGDDALMQAFGTTAPEERQAALDQAIATLDTLAA